MCAETEEAAGMKLKTMYFVFSWCVLAYLFPVDDHRNRSSKHAMHMHVLNKAISEIHMKVKDIPRLEKLKKRKIMFLC